MSIRQTQCSCGVTLHWKPFDAVQRRCIACDEWRDNPHHTPLIDDTMRAEIERHLQAITGGMAHHAVALARFHAILAGEGLPPNVIEHALKEWITLQNNASLPQASMQQRAAAERGPNED